MSHRSRDARRHNFFVIDNEVMDNYGHVIGPIGIAVYCYLARRAGNGESCFPTHDTIAKAIGVSKRSVVEYLFRLAGEDKEKVLASNNLTPLIKIQRRARQDGGATSNDYHLLPVTKSTQTPDTPGNQVHPPVHQVHTPSAAGAHEEDTVEEDKTRSSNELLVEPLERGSSETSSSTTTSGSRKKSGSRKTSGSSEAPPPPHVAIMKEWLDCIGVAEYPPRGDKLWNMARNAAKGGLLPEEVRPIYEWLIKHDRNGFWKDRGIDPTNLLNNRGKWISVGRPGLEKVVPIEGDPEAELQAVRRANARTVHVSFDDRVVKLRNILDTCVRLGVVPNEDELSEAYNYWVQGLIDPAGYPFLLEYDPMRSES